MQRGNALIPVIIMLVAVASFSFMAYLVYQNNHVNDFTDNPALPPVQHVAKNVNTNNAVNTNTTTGNVNNNTNSAAIPSSTFSYQSVKVGDRIGAMTVTKIEPYLANRRDVTPNERITFSGETTITGTVNARFSEFGGSNQVCVTNLDADSLKLVPKAVEDTRAVSFCFSNTDEALKTFPLGTNTVASITIRNYNLVDYPSEVLNTSVFIRGEISTAGWKTYENSEFHFSIKHPADWKATTSENNNATAVTLESANKGESVSFFPEGEFDFSPPSYKTTASVTLGGKAATRVSYSANKDGSNPTVCYYQYTTAPATGWLVPSSEGKYGNRVHTACTESATVKTMLSTFTFDETLGWKTYINSQYHFSFKYPSDWTLSDNHYDANADNPFSSDFVSVTAPTGGIAFTVCPDERGTDCAPFRDAEWTSTTKTVTVGGQAGIETDWILKAGQNCATCTPRSNIALNQRPTGWQGGRDFLLSVGKDNSTIPTQILSTFTFTK